MGKKANRPMQTVQQTENKIDPALVPFRDEILSGASALYNSGVQTEYPDFSTYAGLGTDSRNALGGILDQAAAGGGMTGQASTALAGLLAPEGNPHLDALLAKGSEDIANQVKAAYAAKGRYGSEDFTDALTRGIGDYQLRSRAAAYEGDRNRQLSAIGLAPGLDAARYADSDRALGAGLLLDADEQGRIDAELQRWLFEHGGAESAALEDYAGILAGVPAGGTSSIQQPEKTFLQKLVAAITGGAGIIGAFR